MEKVVTKNGVNNALQRMRKHIETYTFIVRYLENYIHNDRLTEFWKRNLNAVIRRADLCEKALNEDGVALDNILNELHRLDSILDRHIHLGSTIGTTYVNSPSDEHRERYVHMLTCPGLFISEDPDYL